MATKADGIVYMSGHCVRSGTCCECGTTLAAYDSKWFHPDGRMACPHHWLWGNDKHPPSDEWLYYTDG